MRKIKPKTLIKLILPIFIFVIGLLVYVGYAEYKHTKDEAIRQASANVNLAKEYLEQHFSSAEAHLLLLERLWQYSGDTDHLIAAAQEMVDNQPKFLEVGVLVKGSFYATGGFQIVDAEEGVRQRPWFNADAAPGETYITPIYWSSSTEQWSVALVRVITVEGDHDARLILEVDADSLYENLSLLKTLNSGYVYAVEAQTGRIVMHPDPSRVGTPSVSVTPAMLQTIQDGHRSGYIGSYQYDGQLKFSVYDITPSYDWIVLSGTSVADLIKRTLSLGAVSAGLVGMIAILVLVGYITYRINLDGRHLNDVSTPSELTAHLLDMVNDLVTCNGITLLIHDAYNQEYESADGTIVITEKQVVVALKGELQRIRLVSPHEQAGFEHEIVQYQPCIRIPLTQKNQLIGLLYVHNVRFFFPLFAGIVQNYAQSALNHVMLSQRIQSKDAMTGLMNKVYLREQINHQLCRGSDCYYLAMVDIDDFKRINDTHGHLFGDQVILSIAGVLKDSFDQHSVVSRYGGEEFAVLLTVPNEQAVVQKLERLRKTIASTLIANGTKRCCITVSIGVAKVAENVEISIARADRVLYRAKAQGKNQLVYFRPELYAELSLMTQVEV